MPLFNSNTVLNTLPYFIVNDLNNTVWYNYDKIADI